MESARGERHFDCREERCAEGEEPKMELSSQHLRIGWVNIALSCLKYT